MNYNFCEQHQPLPGHFKITGGIPPCPICEIENRRRAAFDEAIEIVKQPIPTPIGWNNVEGAYAKDIIIERLTEARDRKEKG